MPGFTQVFGGTTIAPANASFLLLAMSTDVALAWPIEQAVNGNVVADTIEVVASAPGLNIDIPDARQVSTGYTTCFNNTGGQTVTIRNAVGANILSLVSGTAWVIYLADNSTEGGIWRVFQLGASVSTAVAAALAGAGLRAIGTTLNQDIPITNFNTTPFTLLDTDRAKLMNWTGGLGTLNLPTPGVVGNGWYVQVRNTGSGDLTVTPPSGTIDGAATKTFAAGTSAVVVTDGVDYYTLGFGSGAGGGGTGFDFVEINVAGSGNFTLSGANLNRIAYRFTGILTGNRTIIVPNAIQQYWIANATTGAFSLFVRTAGQTPPGIEVLQNNQAIMYCDGTNVIDAESSTVSFPIPVAQGGTGAVNAATARTNLGAGATGSAIFVSATQADAQTALGLGLAIANVFTVGQTVSNADPYWDVLESDAAANNRLWGMRAAGEQFRLTAWNDARNSAADFMVVDRTNQTVDAIAFTATIMTYNGFEVGYKNIPQTASNPPYTMVAGDAGKHMYASGGSGSAYTIPSNASVPFIIGTMLTFVNRSGGNITIAITSDTLILAGAGSTGTRTLASNSMAQAIKVTSTIWMISGIGLT